MYVVGCCTSEKFLKDVETVFRYRLRKTRYKAGLVLLKVGKHPLPFENGWWQYDERTSKELETSYKAGERICELLIAGFLYVADLEAMLQIRRNDPSRRRRIKRDLANIPKKGIAGLRTESELQNQEQETQYPESSTSTANPVIEDNATPVTPSNTPQSPAIESEFSQENDLQATIDRIGSLRLEDASSGCGNDWRQRRVRTFDL